MFEVGFGDEDISGTAGQETQRHVTHADSGSTSLRLLDPEEEIFFGYPRYITDENLSDEQYEVAAACGAATGTIFRTSRLSTSLRPTIRTNPSTASSAFVSGSRSPRRDGSLELGARAGRSLRGYKQRAYDVALGTFSPSGNFEQDDFAVWDGIAEAAGTVFADKQDVQMNYQMGMPGIGKAEIDEDWDGPGTAWDDNLEEGTCRTFHGNWQKAMNGEEVGMRYPRDHI
ncbi:hypothetical protein D8S78_23215 [Natrialba swarupiae]|nr:hypothetical protein [Natrialba swarupiae]